MTARPTSWATVGGMAAPRRSDPRLDSSRTGNRDTARPSNGLVFTRQRHPLPDVAAADRGRRAVELAGDPTAEPGSYRVGRRDGRTRADVRKLKVATTQTDGYTS